MTVHPVSTLVNKPANDDPRCVEPVAASQLTLSANNSEKIPDSLAL